MKALKNTKLRSTETFSVTINRYVKTEAPMINNDAFATETIIMHNDDVLYQEIVARDSDVSHKDVLQVVDKYLHQFPLRSIIISNTTA